MIFLVDIHTHILPFVDDGSADLQTSVKMLEDQQKSGVDAVILTPHYCPPRKYVKTAAEIKETFENFKNEARKAGVGVRLLLGQEIYWSNSYNVLKMLKSGELLTLNGTNLVLLEFSFSTSAECVSEAIYSLKISGYRSIIAHVERYKRIDFSAVEDMREQGALIQVNADSVIGKNGLKTKFFTNKLIKRGLVDFVASDVHSFRPSALEKAHKKLKTDKYFNALPELLK